VPPSDCELSHDSIDASFIAACSPANMTAILAHVEAQKAEIERLTAERNALRDDNAKLNGWMEEEAQAAGRLQGKLNAAEAEIERLRQWETCGQEWLGKTDWVQERVNAGSWPISALGKHRADVMREEIERLTAERDELHRQLAEAELDARRYRDWLRGGANIPPESTRWVRWEVRYWDGRHWNTLFAEQMDAAIDAAMGLTRPAEEA
jgi:regulator of replication initiation timing